MQQNKLVLIFRIFSQALAGLFILALDLVILPSLGSGQFSPVSIVLGVSCILGALILAYREFKNYDTTLPITREVPIILMALAGLQTLYFGMRILWLLGFKPISFVTMLIGIIFCLCALILSWREEEHTIRFFRVLITAMIGIGIMVFSARGLLMKPAGSLNMLYYSIMFVSIIVLCVALYLAHREYGHYEIKLRD